jgi:hypothetical protein
MTISSTTRIAGPFLSGTALPYTFKVFAAADLNVVRLNTSTGVETSLVLGSDYTVALNGNQNTNPGGTVNLTVAASATSTVTITSDIANLQPTDLTNQGGFYPEVITDSLDRATIQIQQMSEDVGRSLKGPISDGNLNMELPTASQRANSFLAFDANGVPTAVVSGSTGAPTTITRQVFSGTGSQTVFTLASDPGALGNSAQVYIGGVYQQRSTYTIAGTTLTFSAAPVAGTDNIEFVNFLTSNIGATSADLVTYTPAGSGAVARSAASKFNEMPVSIEEFATGGWTIDSGLDATPTLNAALAAIATGAFKTRTLYFPPGSYNFNTKPNNITASTLLVGAGMYRTYIFKRFVSANPGDGIFNFRGGTGIGSESSGVYAMNMTSAASPTSSGGCLISGISSASSSGFTGTIGYVHCRDLYLTSGSGGHDYAIYLDGSVPGVAVRTFLIHGCIIFGGVLGGLYASSCTNLQLVGCNCTNVPGTGKIVLTGIAGYPTQAMIHGTAFAGGFDLDYCVQTSIVASSIGTIINNTANTQYVHVSAGYWAGAQDNWLFSTTSTGTSGLTGTGQVNVSGRINSSDNITANGKGVTGISYPTSSTAWGIASAGAVDTGVLNTVIAVPAGESVRFSCGSSKLFTVGTGGGDGCLAYADYKSATISLVTNPSSTFTNATGTPSRISLTKTSNSHEIRVMNEFASSQNVVICVVGTIPTGLSLGV